MDASGVATAVEDAARTYIRAFGELLDELDLDAVGRLVGRLDDARRREATVYLAGNGGSAATAGHWVNDLNKATKRPDVPPFRAINLSDNISWFTALANDEGYDRVFAGQLESLARPGDLFVVISASGNSQNLIEAVPVARTMGAATIGMLGFDGGLLREALDDYVLVRTPFGQYGPVETMHSLLCDLMTSSLAQEAPRREPNERA